LSINLGKIELGGTCGSPSL